MRLSFFYKLNKLTIIAYWLFTYLLISQGSLPALVVCFGQDSHAAVEMPHKPSPSEEHGGSHTDIPLSVSHDEQPFVSALGPAPQGKFSALTTYLASFPTSVEISRPQIVPRHLPVPASYLASLQTVFLLI